MLFTKRPGLKIHLLANDIYLQMKIRTSTSKLFRANEYFVAFLISILVICFSCTSGSRSLIQINFQEEWDSLKALENPHKGWYHHYLDNGVHKYLMADEEMLRAFPGMDHLYLRVSWAFLEPEEGKFDWTVLDTIIDKYVPLGYKISFRISSKETGGAPGSVPKEIDGVRYATPYWVKLAGAKGTVPAAPASPSWSPDWDDPIYLEKLNNFHKAFAARYDAQPWAIYTDVGGIGDWGEGHTSSSTKVPPTYEEVKAHIDMYLNHYKHTQIVVTDDMLYYGKNAEDIDKLYNYAIDNGITLRDDSPLVDYYIQRYPDTWSVSHPHFYDPLYLKKPIIYELQHYSHVKNNGNWLGKNGEDIIPKYGVSGADLFRNSIKVLRATYIGYHGYLDEFYTDNPDLTGELLNLSGYWYFPVAASHPHVMNPKNNVLKISWLNRGVAPAYNPYSIILRFEDVENSKNIFDLTITESGNKSWLPGIEKEEQYSFNLPSGISKGKYKLKFKLKDTFSENQRDIFIGLKNSNQDMDHFSGLGEVEIK